MLMGFLLGSHTAASLWAKVVLPLFSLLWLSQLGLGYWLSSVALKLVFVSLATSLYVFYIAVVNAYTEV